MSDAQTLHEPEPGSERARELPPAGGDLVAEVRLLVREVLAIDVVDDADLLEGGLLDSLSLVELLFELEREFEMELALEQLEIRIRPVVRRPRGDPLLCPRSLVSPSPTPSGDPRPRVACRGAGPARRMPASSSCSDCSGSGCGRRRPALKVCTSLPGGRRPARKMNLHRVRTARVCGRTAQPDGPSSSHRPCESAARPHSRSRR